MPPPSPKPERAKVAEFYSARSATITPLPWQSFAPPFSGGMCDADREYVVHAQDVDATIGMDRPWSHDLAAKDLELDRSRGPRSGALLLSSDDQTKT
jgi:hypothetical protein